MATTPARMSCRQRFCQDGRGNAKLKRWGRENGLAIIPVYASGGILARGQELERLLSYEFFTRIFCWNQLINSKT